MSAKDIAKQAAILAAIRKHPRPVDRFGRVISGRSKKRPGPACADTEFSTVTADKVPEPPAKLYTDFPPLPRKPRKGKLKP